MKRVIFRHRRRGKTHELLEWVKQAEPTDSYPYWDRVILTYSMNEAQRLRVQLRNEMNDPDAYNLVYTAEEWKTARLGRKPVRVAIDNADILLELVYGPIEIVTISKSY